MRESILVAIRITTNTYLNAVLARNAPEKHAGIKALYDNHMATIADYCIGGYGGAGPLTATFIRDLHRMLFPRGYAYEREVAPGRMEVLVPGEYRDGPCCMDSQIEPGGMLYFAPPEEAEGAMESIIATLNASLQKAAGAREKRRAILLFILDFACIHPFGDANGRVMCMVCDLLLIKEGLPPVHFCAIKEQDRGGLYRAVELAQRNRDLTPLYEVIERYSPEALT